MAEITNLIARNRKSDSESGNSEIATRSLGIIFTGEFSNLDEHLVEAEVAKEFDLNSIKEITTVGKREKTFKYANRFAKKYDLPITPMRLETYSWEENDFYIKRNANIVYKSDDVIIIHGDETLNLVAWYASSVAARVISSDGKCVFASFIEPPNLLGFEKEIIDVFKMPHPYSNNDPYALMESRYLELMNGRRLRFAKYIQKGESMSIKRILFKLTEVILKDYDLDYLTGEVFIAESILDTLICLANKDFQLDEYGGPDEEKIEEYIKKEINPNFHYRVNYREEDVVDTMFYHNWYKLEYLMKNMIHHYEFNDDEEACAALCYGKWIRYLQKKEFSDEDIIEKYSNLQNTL